MDVSVVSGHVVLQHSQQNRTVVLGVLTGISVTRFAFEHARARSAMLIAACNEAFFKLRAAVFSVSFVFRVPNFGFHVVERVRGRNLSNDIFDHDQLKGFPCWGLIEASSASAAA